jgi:sulfur-oxidizing protein SoxY
MFKSRRQFIKKILSLGAYGTAITNGFIYSSFANAQWIKEKFSPGEYQQILTRLFADAELIDSKKISFSRLPRVAENGATVPITIDSSLENVTKIFILVENNPHPLIAEFILSSAVIPHVSARIKMAKTSDVIVIVEAEGKLYRKKQNVKVAIGGCG